MELLKKQIYKNKHKQKYIFQNQNLDLVDFQVYLFMSNLGLSLTNILDNNKILRPRTTGVRIDAGLLRGFGMADPHGGWRSCG